jgi:enamine deaminase RidA (YjgF/YER057c/UK114 family)
VGTPKTTELLERKEIKKRAISAPRALNEAYDYDQPVPFSRGMRVEVGPATFLFLSGTASVGDHGESLHIGDLEAQTRRTCYLRDIERDYDAFNRERKAFYDAEGLDPYPASTGIQAILCRPELLVEIEAIAIIPASRESVEE